ncbi:UvrD-helicase domain-containing protein [Enterobacteriaceae endosymbiont of Donacia semicuprea]|uniref:UvrD-helicase domain-containing protein n=1 Tax=Enterobacteriaceae endosymbiont of Donacia semicuprea TaxID=2675783 RepID=UPI001449D520|nr:UvrD-helicase domain-containing protein [Enterobacteriaceae endosymbiont of Donacia semicuprea]QJC32870.1 AAA family ATPase [Enterobacteriaceae endosymbiont of Donacia semicuprea]
MNNIDLLKNLNNKQKEVVSEIRKNLLILAGAGSGKTLVLIRRIAWLIHKEHCSPKSILAVTFTNKAALELKIRIKLLLNNNKKSSIWIGTFHSFAYYLLRIHYSEAGLSKNFQIIDSYDQKNLIKRILKKMSLKDKIYSIENIIKYINNFKNNLFNNNNIIYKNNLHNINLSKIYDEYQNLCKITEVIDFNELILCLYKLFLNNHNILKIYQKRFKNILIDEFQDTNDIQYKLISLLYNKYYNTKIVLVGDDDQSIYGWRGAKIENINYFLRDFDNVKTILLEQNYRSTSNILNAANKLISYNNIERKKKLWTNSNNGKLISIYYALNEFDEAEYIAKYIKKNFLKKNIKLNNCAILYRNNAQSRILEEIMLKFSIPYQIYGGIRFFERYEIKNILAYLRLISNLNDDNSFERIINVPKRGIGLNTLKIIKFISEKFFLTLWQSSIYILKNKKYLNKKSLNSLRKFVNLIKKLKNNIIEKPLSIIIEETIKNSGLWDMYNKNCLSENNFTKIDNLKEFINAANYFMNISLNNKKKNNLLIDFLSRILLLTDDIDFKKKNNNCNFIQMMTLHASKGLEFSKVFIIGMEEGIFPNKISFNEKNINEERRLAYVGITRAKKKLTLTYTKNRYLYGKEIHSIPSRFLNELPKNCIKKISHLKNKNIFIKKNILKDKKYFIGQNIYHKIFGKGIILNIEILKNNKKLQIKFNNKTIKWIISDYIQVCILK